jgi:hypothetical protein
MLISDLDYLELSADREILAGALTPNVFSLTLDGALIAVNFNGAELVKIDLSKTPNFDYRFSQLPGWKIVLQGSSTPTEPGTAATAIIGQYQNGHFVFSSASSYSALPLTV